MPEGHARIMEDLTPMMKQYHEAKRRFPGKLVFFRLGDFYELFYEDALVASRELEITLTSRNKDKSGKPIPMCGVPYHSVDGYVARLLKKGFKIAICEQVEDPKTARKLVHREVTRILTPGTVVEEMLLEPKDHNFLASLASAPESVGIAFMDLSTADFLATEFRGPDSWARALDELSRFSPRELVLPDQPGEDVQQRLRTDWPEEYVLSQVEGWAFNLDYAQRLLLEHLGVNSLAGFGCEDRPQAVSAAGALIHYLREMHLAPLGKVASLRFFEPSEFMKLDASTIGNLELVQVLALPEEVFAKSGAEGGYALALKKTGLGVALKIEDGGARALGPAVMAVLEQLGLLAPDAKEALAAYAQPPILNHRQEEVGRIKPAFNLGS